MRLMFGAYKSAKLSAKNWNPPNLSGPVVLFYFSKSMSPLISRFHLPFLANTDELNRKIEKSIFSATKTLNYSDSL